MDWRKRGSLAFFTLVVTFMLTTVFSPSTFAKSSSSAAAASSSCAVTYVELHGNQSPTITCVQKQWTGGVHPDIYQTNCGNGDPAFEMWYNSGNNVICFAGAGYIGGSPGWYNVTYITGLYCSRGWVRKYQPGAFVYWNDYGVYNGTPPPYDEVTQVNIDIDRAC